MQIIRKSTWVHTEITEYEPTTAELHYWYSGTHAGPDPNNPYAPRHSMRLTKTKMRRTN